MGVFKEGEYVDIPELQRRGIVKKSPEPEKTGVKFTEDEYVDFSAVGKDKPVASETSGGDLLSNVFGSGGSSSSSLPENFGAESGSSGLLGFMDVGTSESKNERSETKTESSGSFWDVGTSSSGETSEVGKISGADDLEIQGLKNKIEDLEYKLDRLVEKVSQLES